MTPRELRDQIHARCVELNASIIRRNDNMMLGPVGIEERIEVARAGAELALVSVLRLVEVLVDLEKRITELEGSK